jgi:hypothetical protein
MLARKEWFARRKYGGWGVTPKDWRGWLYIIIMIGALAIMHAFIDIPDEQRLFLTAGWVLFLLLDIAPIMVTVEKDERESMQEAISDRNAAWVMVFVLLAGFFYDIIQTSLDGTMKINWFIIGALIAGATAKTITEIAMDKRGIK